MAIPLQLDREFQKDLRRLGSTGSQLAGWISSPKPVTFQKPKSLKPKNKYLVGAFQSYSPSK